MKMIDFFYVDYTLIRKWKNKVSKAFGLSGASYPDIESATSPNSMIFALCELHLPPSVCS